MGQLGQRRQPRIWLQRSLQSNFPEKLTRHHRARRMSRPNVDSRSEAQQLAETEFGTKTLQRSTLFPKLSLLVLLESGRIQRHPPVPRLRTPARKMRRGSSA
ncbi:unnamed protein product [Ectocarpus sp. 13 AM-2016]